MERKNGSFMEIATAAANATAEDTSPQKRPAGDEEGINASSPDMKRARCGGGHFDEEAAHSLERLVGEDDRWSSGDVNLSQQSRAAANKGPPSTPMRRSDSCRSQRHIRSPPSGSVLFLRQESSCCSSTRTEVSDYCHDDQDNDDEDVDDQDIDVEESDYVPISNSTPVPTVDSLGISEGHVASLARRIEGWSLTNLRALRRRNNIYASRSASPTCGGLAAMAAAATTTNDERRRVLNAKKEVIKAFRKSESSMSVDI